MIFYNSLSDFLRSAKKIVAGMKSLLPDVSKWLFVRIMYSLILSVMIVKVNDIFGVSRELGEVW